MSLLKKIVLLFVAEPVPTETIMMVETEEQDTITSTKAVTSVNGDDYKDSLTYTKGQPIVESASDALIIESGQDFDALYDIHKREIFKN